MDHAMNQLTNRSPVDISAQHEQDAKDLTRILPASRKVYVEGSRPDIQVPFRKWFDRKTNRLRR